MQPESGASGEAKVCVGFSKFRKPCRSTSVRRCPLLLFGLDISVFNVLPLPLGRVIISHVQSKVSSMRTYTLIPRIPNLIHGCIEATALRVF